MFAYNSPLSLILGNGQALLAGGTFLFSKTIVGLPFGSASQSVPTNPALCGATAYTQVILTGPTAGGPGFQLTNAQDITIGF
jgi:hypothetical protein